MTDTMTDQQIADLSWQIAEAVLGNPSVEAVFGEDDHSADGFKSDVQIEASRVLRTFTLTASRAQSEVVGYQNLYRTEDGQAFETGASDVDRLEEVQPWAAEFSDHVGIVELRLIPGSAGKSGAELASQLQASRAQSVTDDAVKQLRDARDQWNEKQDKASFDGLGAAIDKIVALEAAQLPARPVVSDEMVERLARHNCPHPWNKISPMVRASYRLSAKSALDAVFDPAPTPTADQPEGDKPKYIGTIGHVDHGKTLLTAAIARLSIQSPTPASGEQMEVVAHSEIEDMIEQLLDAQQDINLAANERMDQSLCDASALIDKTEAFLRRTLVTLEAAQKVLAERDRHIEYLQERDKCCCGCAYDRPDDVCLGHSPKLKAAEARLAQCIEALECLREAIEERHQDGSFDGGDLRQWIASIDATLQQKGGQSDEE